MHILQSKLKNSPEAIEKYKDRKIKIYCADVRLWFMECTVAIIPATLFKGMAKILTVQEALSLTKYYGESRKLEFHFLDDFGEEKSVIGDFELEEIYNCTSVTFEENKRKWEK